MRLFSHPERSTPLDFHQSIVKILKKLITFVWFSVDRVVYRRLNLFLRRMFIISELLEWPWLLYRLAEVPLCVDFLGGFSLIWIVSIKTFYVMWGMRVVSMRVHGSDPGSSLQPAMVYDLTCFNAPNSPWFTTIPDKKVIVNQTSKASLNNLLTAGLLVVCFMLSPVFSVAVSFAQSLVIW